MPSTLREIAELCGVSKQTVRNRLVSMGLWDHHVTVGDATTPSAVDDEASAAVAAALTGKRRPMATSQPELPLATDDHTRQVTELYEARLADLRDRIAALEAEKADLQDRLTDARDQIKALPSPEAVVEARAEGERAGRQAAHDEAQAAADARIADAKAAARAEGEAAGKDAARAAGLLDRILGRF